MTLVSLLSIIHVQTDKLIVSRLLPLGTFGLYAFGSSAVNRGMLLTGAVAQAAFPSMSQLHGESRFDSRLQNRYLRLQDLVSYASAAVFAVSPFATLPVIGLLFGPAQAETMLVPATLLALGFYMNSTLNMPYFLSLAVGKPRIALSFNAWALVIVLPTTVLLVTWWQLEGAALSWVVYNLFGYAYFVPRVCRECEGVSVWRWYLNVGRFLAMAVAVYGAAWMAVALLTETSPALLAISYSSATLVYALAGWRALSVHSRERLSAVWGAKAVESVS
jgi:O-antigen/teichoic acid export membrane protein